MLPVIGAVLLGLFVSQVALMVTSVYLHRSLAHRSLRLAPGVQGVCRVLTWMLFGMRPRQWVAVHRKHHAFTDTPRDPHSPRIFGYPRVQFANAMLYRRVARDRATVDRYARDIPRDRWDRWLLNHAVVGLSLGTGLMVLLIGWELTLIAAAVHAAYYLLGGGAINAIGHRWGRRPYDNFATNNQWLAWLVVGEGTSQQPSRRRYFVQAQSRQRRVRPRVVVYPSPRVAGVGHTPPAEGPVVRPGGRSRAVRPGIDAVTAAVARALPAPPPRHFLRWAWAPPSMPGWHTGSRVERERTCSCSWQNTDMVDTVSTPGVCALFLCRLNELP